MNEMSALKLLGALPICRARVSLPYPSLSFPISNLIVMARVTLRAVLTQTMGLTGERCAHQ